MRPIFRPRARVRECCPSRVGLGSVGGCRGALFAAEDFVLDGVLFAAGVAASFAASLADAGSFSLAAETLSFVLSATFALVLSASSFAGATAIAAGAGADVAFFAVVTAALLRTSITKR